MDKASAADTENTLHERMLRLFVNLGVEGRARYNALLSAAGGDEFGSELSVEEHLRFLVAAESLDEFLVARDELVLASAATG